MHVQASLVLPTDGQLVGAVRDAIAGLLAALDAPGDAVTDLQLALTEACSNVLRHAGGVVEYQVTFSAVAGRCELHVYDRGPGFEPAVARSGVAGSTDERGRGLVLMEALTDDVQVTADGRRTTVRLLKTW